MNRALAYFAALWLLPLFALPQSSLAEEPLRFHTLELPPFGFLDETDAPRGILFDVTEALIKEADIDTDHRLLPMARIIRQLSVGKTDCTIVTRSPYSESLAEPVADLKTPVHGAVLFPKKSTLSGYDDLQGQTIAVVRGSHFNHSLDDDTAINKIWVDNDRLAVLMLMANRVAAIAGPLEGFLYIMQKEGISREVIKEPLVLVKRNFWIHCVHGAITKSTKDALVKSTERLTSDGTIQRIWDTYLHRPSREAMVKNTN